ncbi:hypothetical protein [Nonomuraea sp. NPDC050643]|uniref:hypothetical protein n=1 Tax=Nonomuraea sp. NPDC050643 TaxID=3155660 RepID=UPI00340B97DD
MNLFKDACPIKGFPILDSLPWRKEPEVALCDARVLLQPASLAEELAVWLTSLTAEQMDRIIDFSVERSTHYKWFLGRQPHGYTVWLHEYKPPEVFAYAIGFATSVHNHRYSFISRVISGALNVSAFMAYLNDDHPLVLTGQSRIEQGQTMFLEHEDIHRIDHVDSHTYTVLIQGPPARDYSICYDPETGVSHRIYDLRSHLPRTFAHLVESYGSVAYGKHSTSLLPRANNT